MPPHPAETRQEMPGPSGARRPDRTDRAGGSPRYIWSAGYRRTLGRSGRDGLSGTGGLVWPPWCTRSAWPAGDDGTDWATGSLWRDRTDRTNGGQRDDYPAHGDALRPAPEYQRAPHRRG